MTLASSANNTGADTEFILRGRSFIYIQSNITDPQGTPHFNVPQSETTFSDVVGDFTSTFCLLLVK